MRGQLDGRGAAKFAGHIGGQAEGVPDWATLGRLLTVETLRIDPGGKGIFLSINDEEFVNAAKVTYALPSTAGRLFTSRHLEPSPRGALTRAGWSGRSKRSPYGATREVGALAAL